MVSGSASGDELQELMETENPDDLTMTTAEYGNDTSMFEASPPATKEVFRKRQNDPVARRLPIRDDLFSKCGARRAPWGLARAHVPLHRRHRRLALSLGHHYNRLAGRGRGPK